MGLIQAAAVIMTISWNAQADEIYWSLGPDLYQASVGNLFAIKAKDAESKAAEQGHLT